ncbi:hypothetical protein F5X99DRAFT_51199 [Biscogniauxia marginata]|nr:hypothetical protein F5X99DRAFT_51199 [Biscogniauxia marginata]
MDSSGCYIPTQCVAPRCRLCLFSISKNESIIAVTEAGSKTAEFPYPNSNNFTDSGLRLKLAPCRALCSHPNGLVIGYHSKCFSFASRSKYLSLASSFKPFLRATEYSFEPPESEQSRRRTRIQMIMDAKLDAIYMKFPTEICSIINEHLDQSYEDRVRHWAITTTAITLERALSGRFGYHALVNTNSSIWAQYVYLDGIQYISALSNIPEGDTNACVLDIGKAQLIDTLYVLEDHLGVRQIIFARSEDIIEVPCVNDGVRGTWWQTISTSSKALQVESDGFKLRCITTTTLTESHHVTLWSAPMPQHQIDLLHFHSILPPNSGLTSPKTLRMASLKSNSDEITGYSGCWNGRIISLHAHSEGEDMSFYRSSDIRLRNAAWIYTPLDSGETIVSLWRRCGKWQHYVPLTFQTNKGRVATIGPYAESGRFAARHTTRVFTAPEGATRIYFDDSPIGISRLATSSPAEEGPAPSQNASSSRPFGTCITEFIYTSAFLHNVAEVIPCRQRYGTSSRITGLLICYSDKSRACVGEFRLDSVAATLQVGSSPKLYLGFARTEFTYPHVVRMELFPPEDGGSLEWLELPWEGKLEWWFSYWECQICHGDKRSPGVR